jgi:membrane dipeptidase
MQRRDFLRMVTAAGACALGVRGTSSAAEHAVTAIAPTAADAFTVDAHSHAWRHAAFGMAMRQGGIDMAVLVAVADRPLITFAGRRLRATGSAPRGHLHYHATRQLGDLKRAIENQNLALVRTPAEAAAAKRAGEPGILIGYEGGDVLEGELDRLGEAYADGVRLLQLVHYRINELGDIQTEDPVHNGLTPFGAAAVRECNRLGIIVDLAHATPDVVRQTLAVATRPPLLSHTYFSDAQRLHTRGINRAHARAIAEAGGVVGVVPFPSVYPTLDNYAIGIARMAEIAGVDHVGIGSDIAGIPSGIPPLADYGQYPQLVRALTEAGFMPEERAKILGGNFMRVFNAVAA